MKRRHEKGLLKRSKVNHAFVYIPAFSKEEFQREAVREVEDALFNEDADAMVAASVDVADQAGDDTLAQLEQLHRRATSRQPECPMNALLVAWVAAVS